MINKINRELKELKIIRVHYEPENDQLIKYVKKYYDDIEEYLLDVVKAVIHATTYVEVDLDYCVHEYVNNDYFAYAHIYNRLDQVINIIKINTLENKDCYLLKNMQIILPYIHPKIREFSEISDLRFERVESAEQKINARQRRLEV